MRPEWRIDDEPVPYLAAVSTMEVRAAAIRNGMASELVWLLEHPPLYSAGTSAHPGDLLTPDRFPVYRSGRGGQYTYHGPGQRVAYAMLDLKRRGGDIRRYVWTLEEWLIQTLARFAVRGERRPGRVGVWVAPAGGRDAKIAAIGVRIRRWVSFHGVALNVDPDLEHFTGIVPCGLSDSAVTSLMALGHPVDTPSVDVALREAFDEVFGQ